MPSKTSAPSNGTLPIPAPEGDIAILFIDLVSSSFLWTNHPSAMKKYLRSFRRLIRRFTPTNQGYEVKSIGDGFLIVFVNAVQALEFSLTIQAKLPELSAQSDFPDLGEPVKARIGVHFGEPDDSEIDELTKRRDYWGRAVDIAKRIEGEADPGQIAVSGEFLLQLLRNLNVEFEELHLESENVANIEERILGLGAPWWDVEVRDRRLRSLRGCGDLWITSISLKRR